MLASPPDWLRSTFIAALAITGSPKQAARALGRHMFGAQQLRNARGGKGFDAAWDAAMEIARDREFAQIHANLSTLAAERDASEVGQTPSQNAGRALPRLNHPRAHPADLYGETIDEEASEERRAILTTRLHIREKLTRARRILLLFIGTDPAKRDAWEVLVGPVDWDRASRCESQADEPFADPESEYYEGHDIHPHCMTQPGMMLTAEAGLLADLTGGHDTIAELVEKSAELDAEEAEKDATASDPTSPLPPAEGEGEGEGDGDGDGDADGEAPTLEDEPD